MNFIFDKIIKDNRSFIKYCFHHSKIKSISSYHRIFYFCTRVNIPATIIKRKINITLSTHA